MTAAATTMKTSEFVQPSEYPARHRSLHTPVKMSILHTMKKIFAVRGYRFMKTRERERAAYSPYASWIGTRGEFETLCIRTRVSALHPDEVRSWEVLYEPDIRKLCELIRMNPDKRILRCEVWVFFPEGENAGIEVTRDGAQSLVCLMGDPFQRENMHDSFMAEKTGAGIVDGDGE